MTRETFEAPVPGGVLWGHLQGPVDAPRAVLLHGGPGLSVSFVDDLAAELATAYRVATFQQRGVEPSTTTGDFTVAEAVTDVAAVLDHLGWDRAYVVGHSWGGHLAFWVAASLPGRLLGVLSVDPLGAVGDGGNAAFEAEMAARTPEDARDRATELDHLAQQGEVSEELALEGLRLVWPAYFADPGTAPPMPAESRLSVEAYSGLFTDLVERLPELEASLPSITVPVSVLVGDVSPIPMSAGLNSAALIPGALTVVVEGAGHFPSYEKPGCVVAALDELSATRAW